MAASLDDARAAQRRAAQWLADQGLAGAVGIAPGEDGFAVKLSLTRPLPPGVEAPARIAGVPVWVEVVGPLRPR